MQHALALFDTISSVEALRARREDQWFERKSILTKDLDFAAEMIGFANADGGRIVVGIHNGQFEGVDSHIAQVNDLLQAAVRYSHPPVRFSDGYVPCTNRNGVADRLLIVDIEASERIHRNQKNECFLRVGDENRKLNGIEERELAFDKGESVYDSSLVPDLGLGDLDRDSLLGYLARTSGEDLSRLLHSRGLFIDTQSRKGVTQAGWLLFGRTPPVWSYVRYLRYDGTIAETGTRSNLIKDVRLEGTIPALIDQSKALMTQELRVERLTGSGRFQEVLSLPEFAWLEAIVNAVTHRSYSMQGDGIRIRQFSDRLEVESPGRLPELVRVDNIRRSRFSRNPHIARVLAETTDYVREMNEGINRMFQEMQQAGLQPPRIDVTSSGVLVTLDKEVVRTAPTEAIGESISNIRKRMGNERYRAFLEAFAARERLSTHEVAAVLSVTPLTARRYLKMFEALGIVARIAGGRYDPTARWAMQSTAFLLSAEHGGDTR